MNIILITIGTLKESYWKDAFEEYQKRLNGFCKFQHINLKETKLNDNPSKAEIDLALQDEGKRIISNIPPQSYVISLCIEGNQLSSEDFAKKLEQITANASTIVFVIGSSFGLHDSVKNLSNMKFSFSKLTFPHQMARVICMEAIYRCLNILKGTKYHK